MALGKFGGRELGYASDLELIFIYEGDGGTNHSESPVTNGEYFNQLVQWLKKYILAKEAGIFELDFRLRPYGNKGPLSVHFDLFRSYYSRSGEAYDFERQALLKLRFICGDETQSHADRSRSAG
jgi:glutamate-ammonia-ligase adenylyltransferase